MKTLFNRSIVLAGLAVLAVAAIAYAHGGYGYGGYHMMGGGYGPGYGHGSMMGNGYGPGYGHGYGNGHGHMNGYHGPDLSQLSAEQRQAYGDLAEAHYKHMTDLRDQAVVFQNQLRSADDAQSVAQARDGLTDVANRMDQEMATFRDQAREQFGIAEAAYGPGYAGCPGWNRNW